MMIAATITHRRIPALKRQFVIEFYYIGLASISFGFHIDFKMMNAQLHIPFGFIHIGMESKFEMIKCSHFCFPKSS